MKPNLLEEILSLVEDNGRAADAIGAIPHGGKPDPLPGPPEVEAGPPADTGRPDDAPPIEVGRPDGLPSEESAAPVFDEATGLPCIATESVPGEFPGEAEDMLEDAESILTFLF